MGGVLSSSATNVEKVLPDSKQTTEVNKTDTIPSTSTIPANTISDTITESTNEQVSDPKPEEVTVTTIETKPEEVLERYIEPKGTPFEVAPVEVNPLTDVVKKNKKRNKKNKSKN
jgi:hypothetical protein